MICLSWIRVWTLSISKMTTVCWTVWRGPMMVSCWLSPLRVVSCNIFDISAVMAVLILLLKARFTRTSLMCQLSELHSETKLLTWAPCKKCRCWMWTMTSPCAPRWRHTWSLHTSPSDRTTLRVHWTTPSGSTHSQIVTVCWASGISFDCLLWRFRRWASEQRPQGVQWIHPWPQLKQPIRLHTVRWTSASSLGLVNRPFLVVSVVNHSYVLCPILTPLIYRCCLDRRKWCFGNSSSYLVPRQGMLYYWIPLSIF